MIGLNDFERDGDEFYDNDPDSWALIPEFNKTPSSVDFKGFKYPMFGRGVRPEVSRSIFEMMKAVRTQARKRFASLKEIEALASKAIPSEALATAIVDAPSTLTSEGIFALRYELFCYYVAQFLVTYPKDMDNSIEPLALAAAEIAGMMNEKPIDAEEMQKIRAEIKNKRSQDATNAANALHNKPGGNRDKQKAIKLAWASGKFDSRDSCAEQECAALGMSFSAARKALRNTPKPT